MARADRPALSTRSARRAVDVLWRMESARVVGALARFTGDIWLAEDVAQEALAEALVSWSLGGLPQDPTGWLLTTGRRRAIDAMRRRSALNARYEALAADLDERYEEVFDPESIGDDVVNLMFIACHPLLSSEAQLALTLRVVGGLSTQEIANAFLVPVATVQARITRAKKTLAAARVEFAAPSVDERSKRLGSVLHVVYLMFTEGSFPSLTDGGIRSALADEACRLARVLSHLEPSPETFGLLALLELTAARFPARVDRAGDPVLLEDQDRRLWDRAAIVRGRAALARATEGARGLGPYGLQAAIAECHTLAPSVEETDWQRIVLLYDALQKIASSPIVELNRAIAIGMRAGPAAGLEAVELLAGRGELAGSHLIASVRGELLLRLGRPDEASREFESAIAACRNPSELVVLRRKLARLERGDSPAARRQRAPVRRLMGSGSNPAL